MLGPALIVLAALTWTTDGIFRFEAINQFDPIFIVFVEHLFAVALLLPWMLFKHRSTFFHLSVQQWFSAFVCGALGSAFAMVLFTASFAYLNPSVSILFQKTQPIMVGLLAFAILGERPKQKFYFWGLIAVLAAVVLTVPDLNFGGIFRDMSLRSKGLYYSFAAAVLWALSTVFGKSLLNRTPLSVALFWRFAFGFLTLLLISNQFEHSPAPAWAANLAHPSSGLTGHALGNLFSLGELFHNPQTFLALSYLSLVPGLLGMALYYAGLSRTPANVATFIELVYPVGSVFLNVLVLHIHLDWSQMIASLVLLVSVTVLSL